MSNAEIRGRFVWHELMTTDPQGAGAFYTKVLNWKTQPSGMPDYTLWVSGKTQAGGLMAQPESGAPPSWLIYIGTPDVDGTAAAAQRLGGKMLKPPADIPGVGRFAVLSDPQGATFAIFTPGLQPGGGKPASDFCWHELATTDPQGAVTFYSELFGWSRGGAHDMGGPVGIYQMIEHGGTQVGGVYKLMDTSKPSHWLTYIRVGSVDRAVAAAKAAGGRVTQDPMEVPGGGRIALILDPQGGSFAVHELAKQAAAASAPAENSSAPGKQATAKSRPAARMSKGPGKRAPARKAHARPAKKAAAKAKKRPAAKRSAKKSPPKKAARKRAPARKAAGKKVAKRSARKSARRR